MCALYTLLMVMMQLLTEDVPRRAAGREEEGTQWGRGQSNVGTWHKETLYNVNGRP